MKIKIRGMHGTTKSAAEQIALKGMQPASVKKLAGAGMYFWAYDTYDVRAKALALAWWQYKQSIGHYRLHKNPYFALIKLELELEEEELIDLDSVEHQDGLLATEARLVRKNGGLPVTSEALYTTYVSAVSILMGRLPKPVVPKVLKAMLPPPEGFPYSRAHLTSAVNGYIVLPGAVGLLDPSVLSVIK